MALAATFRIVALAFSAPRPGLAAVQRAALFRLAVGDLDASLRRVVTVARMSWLGASPGALADDYMRLFMGRASVSLHETAYGDGRRVNGRPVELADIGGYYAAFGVELREANPDLPDHISAECEFISMLLVKEAYALGHGWGVQWRTTRQALGGFLRDHLGRWPHCLLPSLREEDASPPYRDMTRLLVALVASECRRHGVRPERADARMPFDPVQEDEFVCPRAEPPQ
ncbi:MAG: molecular chaperone TorD family protein [Alphaproteobacteria bacterium]